MTRIRRRGKWDEEEKIARKWVALGVGGHYRMKVMSCCAYAIEIT